MSDSGLCGCRTGLHGYNGSGASPKMPKGTTTKMPERTFYHSFTDEESLLDALTKVGLRPAVCLPDKRDRCELRSVIDFADSPGYARTNSRECFRNCKKVKIIVEKL